MSQPVTSELDPKNLFPFPLDDFQLQAIAALNAGKSVVVCAPTGSGKTLIGEYAIHRALARGKRVFYTTPLKALSNQKLRDFTERFGGDNGDRTSNIGLITGDIIVHPEAPILVMTTEIFRNMLYGTRIGEVGTSLTDLETVVLDEFHYMNDQQRGTVWEEAVIYCPPEIQLVALSATIGNSKDLTDWIHQVHGDRRPTELIDHNHRSVPLQFHFCNAKGIFPLFDNSGKKINPRLVPRGRAKSGKKMREPRLTSILGSLYERDMLPAIYFIFSRRQCDRAVDICSDLMLVNEAEAIELQERINTFLRLYPDAGRAGQVDPLYQGIAAHHAGILPAWKGLVEELFQDGLIKVVFATETLAAGINMPARTTVISSLSKRTDDGHRLLKATEFLQMAGRAGRRGIDTQGHVVAVQTQFEGAREASYLAQATAEPLQSWFTPSYGMVLNLLQNHSLEEARELVERSFGEYLVSKKPKSEAIAAKEAEIVHLQEQLNDVDLKLLGSYQKLQERLKVEQQLLKTLQYQAEEVRAEHMAIALNFSVPGTVLSLQGHNVPTAKPLRAVLVDKVQNGKPVADLVCLAENNRWYVVTPQDVVELHAEIPRMRVVDTLQPPPMPLQVGQSCQGSADTASAIARIPEVAPLPPAPEVTSQISRVQAIEEQLEDHPLQQFGNPKKLLSRWRRIEQLQNELANQIEQDGRQPTYNWKKFLDLVEVLQEFEALEPAKTNESGQTAILPTSLGETAAALRGDNELWLALAMRSGALDILEPHHLAAACASLAIEFRLDTDTDYTLSPEVDRALTELWNVRKQVIKVQHRHGVEFLVLPSKRSDVSLCALVEHWVLEVEWSELCDRCSLDEGDLVRILRRTLDFLLQIAVPVSEPKSKRQRPYVPHLSESLRGNAQEAIRRIRRFPVSEE